MSEQPVTGAPRPPDRVPPNPPVYETIKKGQDPGQVEKRKG